MFTIPPFSPTLIIPNHKVITPARPKDNSNPVFAISKVEDIIAGKTVVSPNNTNLMRAITNARKKNAIQI
jgi:hypothetical protein